MKIALIIIMTMVAYIFAGLAGHYIALGDYSAAAIDTVTVIIELILISNTLKEY